jgi:hypothetical protein
MKHKINTTSGYLINTLISQKHLTKGIVVVGTLPWLFDCLDMFQLSD